MCVCSVSSKAPAIFAGAKRKGAPADPTPKAAAKKAAKLAQAGEPPPPRHAGLPEGWEEQRHEAPARTYTTYRGPSGERTRSRAEAWRLFHTAAQPQATASAAGDAAAAAAAAAVLAPDAREGAAMPTTLHRRPCGRPPKASNGKGSKAWCPYSGRYVDPPTTAAP